MSVEKPPLRSSLGLIVLFLLWEEPMHGYRMQKMIQVEGYPDRIMYAITGAGRT